MLSHKSPSILMPPLVAMNLLRSIGTAIFRVHCRCTGCVMHLLEKSFWRHRQLLLNVPIKEKFRYSWRPILKVLYQSSSSYMMLSGPLSRIQLCNTQHAITIFTCMLKGKYDLFARTLKRFFSVPNARSTIVRREECRRLNNSCGVSGYLPPPYSFK